MKLLLWTTTLAATATFVAGANTEVTTPLPYHVYAAGTNCTGTPSGSGTTVSFKALDEEGAFCESTEQLLIGSMDDPVPVHTKLVFESCDLIQMSGFVSVSTYFCKDSDCSECTDMDVNFAFAAELKVPKFDPLPAKDTCWEIMATSTRTSTLNHFDKTADKDAVDTYWKVLAENSCLSDSITLPNGGGGSSPVAAPASNVAAPGPSAATSTTTKKTTLLASGILASVIVLFL